VLGEFRQSSVGRSYAVVVSRQPWFCGPTHGHLADSAI